jgi:hypothetical protein
MMHRLTRRLFLQKACGVAGGLSLAAMFTPAIVPGHTSAESRPESDEEIFARVMKLAGQENVASLPIGDGMAVIGLSFVGVPYRAHTLETPGDECLVVNLRELDCTTFMENVLVLTRCSKKGSRSFADYKKELQFVRYRGGIIDGYPSRLHYFIDWVGDNEAKKILSDATRTLGGGRIDKKIDFMSTHPESYAQLKAAGFVERIVATEKSLTHRGFYAVPRDKVPGIARKLRNGDIIGTVTSMKGIDVSHTGLIVVQDGVPKFLHAPLSGGHVQLADGSIADHVSRNRSVSGIIVARPDEP